MNETPATENQADRHISAGLWWVALSTMSFLFPILIDFCLLLAGAGPNFEFSWAPLRLIRGSGMDITQAEVIGFLIPTVGPAIVGFVSAILLRMCKVPPVIAVAVWLVFVPLFSWGLGLVAFGDRSEAARFKMHDLVQPIQ